jgi:hypothetical protein
MAFVLAHMEDDIARVDVDQHHTEEDSHGRIEERSDYSSVPPHAIALPLECVSAYRRSDFENHVRSLSLTTSADATAVTKPASVVRKTPRPTRNIATATPSR